MILPHRLHCWLRHRWYGGLRIDAGLVRWRCCGDRYAVIDREYLF